MNNRTDSCDGSEMRFPTPEGIDFCSSLLSRHLIVLLLRAPIDLAFSTPFTGLIDGRIAQEGQEEEKGTPDSVILEEEEGKEEDRGINSITNLRKSSDINK